MVGVASKGYSENREVSLKRILVPIDGSDFSFRAAKYGIKLAKLENAELIVMHAVTNPPYVEYAGPAVTIVHYIEEARRHAEAWLKQVGDMASKEGIKYSTEIILDVVAPADSIATYAENKKIDLIVMGTKGRSGLKRFLLGSVASGVVAHARCSVLVVR